VEGEGETDHQAPAYFSARFFRRTGDAGEGRNEQLAPGIFRCAARSAARIVFALIVSHRERTPPHCQRLEARQSPVRSGF
jgi:hypothetical protein